MRVYEICRVEFEWVCGCVGIYCDGEDAIQNAEVDA